MEREYTLQRTLGVAGAVPSAITLGGAATTMMTTSGIGLASNITQVETYCGQDSTGWAWSRTITAQGGFAISDGDGLAVCGYSSSQGDVNGPDPTGPSEPRSAPSGSGLFLGGLPLLDLLAMGLAWGLALLLGQRGKPDTR